MTSPTISVAMATYNGAKYLREQLDSIDQQTLCPLELIVSDDGSTDETVQIVRDFSRSARFPVKLLIRDEHLGFRKNFLEAAAACSGDIVSFCDQDDVWYPGKLEAVSRLMGSEPDVMLCFHNSMIVDRDRAAIQLFYTQAPCAARVDPLTLSPPFRPFGYSQSLRADLLKLIPYCAKTGDWLVKAEMAAHDVFFFCLASSIGRIAYLEEPLVEYRQHGGNTFGVSTGAPRTGAVSRFGELLQHSSEVLRRYSRISEQYAVAAREFGSVSNAVSPGTVDKAVASWHLLARAYRLRSEVQGGRSVVARSKAFYRLQRLGCYGERGFWTAGTTAGVRDLVAGVLFGPLVTQFGNPAFADGNIRMSRRRDAASLPAAMLSPIDELGSRRAARPQGRSHPKPDRSHDRSFDSAHGQKARPVDRAA